MGYIRKTRDIYEIHEYVPDYGWEYSCTEESYSDARMQLKCYRDNGVIAKIVKRRERIE